jgi:hypothetical protein
MKITIDPLDMHTEIPQEHLVESLGYIPYFLKQRMSDETAKEALTRMYGFGELFEMTNGKVVDYVYKYSGDPDLYPIAEMTSGNTTVLQYKYGIIAILEENGSTFVTRMD